METENLVLGRGGIVARLAGIHGPGRSATLTRFLRGEAAIHPDNDRFMNYVHRDDIAAALLVLAERPARQNSIYNIADDSPILRSECYRWLAEKLGEYGRSLRPGDIVMTGSFVRQFPLHPGDAAVAEFSGIGRVEVSIAKA